MCEQFLEDNFKRHGQLLSNTSGFRRLMFGGKPELMFGGKPELVFGGKPELVFGGKPELVFGRNLSWCLEENLR